MYVLLPTSSAEGSYIFFSFHVTYGNLPEAGTLADMQDISSHNSLLFVGSFEKVKHFGKHIGEAIL